MAESKNRSDAEQVTAVVAGAVTSMVLGVAAIHDPALALAAPAAGGAAAQLLTWFGFDKLGRASESYSAGFRRSVGSTLDPDEVRRRAAEEPAFRDRIHATLRELEASLDLASAPALGCLAAEYARPNPPRPPDSFFRGTLRLLRSITGDELIALQTMCTAISALDVPAGYEALTLTEVALAPGAPSELSRDGPDPEKPGSTRRLAVGLRSPHHLAIFRLLKEGLGSDNPGGFIGVMSGPQILVLPIANIIRLRAVLGPAPASTRTRDR